MHIWRGKEGEDAGNKSERHLVLEGKIRGNWEWAGTVWNDAGRNLGRNLLTSCVPCDRVFVNLLSVIISEILQAAR